MTEVLELEQGSPQESHPHFKAGKRKRSDDENIKREKTADDSDEHNKKFILVYDHLMNHAFRKLPERSEERAGLRMAESRFLMILQNCWFPE